MRHSYVFSEVKNSRSSDTHTSYQLTAEVGFDDADILNLWSSEHSGWETGTSTESGNNFTCSVDLRDDDNERQSEVWPTVIFRQRRRGTPM